MKSISIYNTILDILIWFKLIKIFKKKIEIIYYIALRIQNNKKDGNKINKN